MKTRRISTLFMLLALLLPSACYKQVESDISVLERRIEKLEKRCQEMNTTLEGLRTVVANVQKYDFLTRIEPIVGQVYTNRGGGRYRCIAPSDAGRMFYNAAGGFSNSSAVMQNVKSGWTFTAKGILQYIDETIEWDHSIGGHFEEVRA